MNQQVPRSVLLTLPFNDRRNSCRIKLEDRFECWLPRSMPLGPDAGQASREASVLTEIRIAMFWDETKQATIRKLKDRMIEVQRGSARADQGSAR